MSDVFQLSESGRVGYFRWTSGGVIYAPSPAPTALLYALDGTSASITLTQQGSGTSTRYYADLSEAGAGLYEIVASTTDTNADCAVFQAEVRIGQAWIQTLNGLVQAIWDKATNALTTSGSIGVFVLTKLGLITAANISVNTGTQPQTGRWTLYDQDYDLASGQTLPTWTSTDWTSYDLLNAKSITGYWKLSSAVEVAFPTGALTCPDETTVQLTALTRTQAQAVNYGSGIGFMIRAVLSDAKGGGTIELVNTSMSHVNYSALSRQP